MADLKKIINPVYTGDIKQHLNPLYRSQSEQVLPVYKKDTGRHEPKVGLSENLKQVVSLPSSLVVSPELSERHANSHMEAKADPEVVKLVDFEADDWLKTDRVIRYSSTHALHWVCGLLKFQSMLPFLMKIHEIGVEDRDIFLGLGVLLKKHFPYFEQAKSYLLVNDVCARLREKDESFSECLALVYVKDVDKVDTWLQFRNKILPKLEGLSDSHIFHQAIVDRVFYDEGYVSRWDRRRESIADGYLKHAYQKLGDCESFRVQFVRGFFKEGRVLEDAIDCLTRFHFDTFAVSLKERPLSEYFFALGDLMCYAKKEDVDRYWRLVLEDMRESFEAKGVVFKRFLESYMRGFLKNEKRFPLLLMHLVKVLEKLYSDPILKDKQGKGIDVVWSKSQFLEKCLVWALEEGRFDLVEESVFESVYNGKAVKVADICVRDIDFIDKHFPDADYDERLDILSKAIEYAARDGKNGLDLSHIKRICMPVSGYAQDMALCTRHYNKMALKYLQLLCEHKKDVFTSEFEELIQGVEDKAIKDSMLKAYLSYACRAGRFDLVAKWLE